MRVYFLHRFIKKISDIDIELKYIFMTIVVMTKIVIKNKEGG